MLLDEAHTLDKDVCQSLLNVAQSIINDAPFLFVMAGTPGLMPFLGTVGATFVGRSKSIGVGTLNQQTAADAIRIPIEKESIAIAEDALDIIVADSQHHPFFLRVWGEALWALAGDKNIRHLDKDAAWEAGKTAHVKRVGFYEERFSGIVHDEELLAAAIAVGAAYESGGAYDNRGVVKIIDNALKATIADDDARWKKAWALSDALNALDFVRRPPNSIRVIPGIPSFMTYVSDRYAEQVALERDVVR